MGAYLERRPGEIQKACDLSDVELRALLAGYAAWEECMKPAERWTWAGWRECDVVANKAAGSVKLECVRAALFSAVLIEAGWPVSGDDATTTSAPKQVTPAPETE